MDYSQVEVAVAARHDGCSCSTSPWESITKKQASSKIGSPLGIKFGP